MRHQARIYVGMTMKRFVIAAVLGLSLSSAAPAVAAEEETIATIDRPAILPALYATLGAMQAWDVYSTRAAIQAGAREANPAAAAFAGSAGSMLGLKAATTASTIFFAERMWKKNKLGAVVMMVAINGATAAVSMHNMRNAKKLSTR